MEMKYDWILFDADGTLFDYCKAEAAALENTFRQRGLPFSGKVMELYREINEKVWFDFENGRITSDRLRTKRFEILFREIGVESDTGSFSAGYLSALSSRTDLLDGAQDLLESISSSIRMVLITNGLREVQRARVANSSIGHYFEDVVISEETGYAKPDRCIFEVAFDRMGNPGRDRVLMVGDSLTSDIRGGNNYGIDTCWFNPSEQACDQDVRIDYEITHLDELRSIIEKR